MEDMIDPVVVLLNEQGSRLTPKQFQQAEYVTYSDLDLKMNNEMKKTYEINMINRRDKEKLRKLWKDHTEIASVFGSSSELSSRYVGSYLFNLKRLYQLLTTKDGFNFRGSGERVDFNGREWHKNELPSDPEVVASFFTKVLDLSASKFKEGASLNPKLAIDQEQHLLGYTDIPKVNTLNKEMVGLLSLTPPGFIPHFQLIQDQRLVEVLSGDYNLFFGIMMVVRVLWKKHKGSKKYYFVNEAYS